METKFTAVAMRCNKEQFEAIKPKLKGKDTIIWCFGKYPYLCNNFDNKKNITNISKGNETFKTYKKYETWNEATFLRACGIEVKPTLEEVKAYFKNAKEVKSQDHVGKQIIDISNYEYFDFNRDGVIWLNDCCLWDDEMGYAEIISYKDEPLTVSKEFILDLHKEVVWPSVKAKIEREFPSVFEPKPTEMTVAEIEQKLGLKIKIVG